MTDVDPAEGPGERHSVLGDLPRTRPQRKSARREAARAQVSQTGAQKPATTKAGASRTAAAKTAAAKKGAARAAQKPVTAAKKGAASKGAAATDGKRPSTPSRRRAAPRTHRTGAASPEPTPRQGYEADSEAVGTPVSPPSGAELVGSLAELAGELAQTGISAGGRLLRRAVSRISRP